MRLRNTVKRALFGDTVVSQWVAVGIADDRLNVAAWLDGMGEPRDVTLNNVIVSLRPFLIGIGLDGGQSLGDLQQRRLILRFVEEGERQQRTVGEIRLRAVDLIPKGERALATFAPAGCVNRCLPQAQVLARRAFMSYRQIRDRKTADPYNFQVAPADLDSLFLFYVRPRPVVLVSVVHEDRGNIFPMDLIGPTECGYFTLALRSTSPSVELIKASRRIVLSSVPADQVGIAYDLGKHHRKPSIDWDALPMTMTHSAHFGLPAPCFALRVREMEIDSFQVVGSHTLFFARTASDERGADGQPLFHIPGFFQTYRTRMGRSLNSAFPGTSGV